MKVELEVSAFGEVEVPGTENAFQGLELTRVHNLSKDTTLGEVEELLSSLFDEVTKNYKNPEQCAGKITVRAKRENGDMIYLG